MYFEHPEPLRTAASVMPVFIPFAGCAARCIFCSQEAQTGSPKKTLAALLHDLEKRCAASFSDPVSAGKGGPPELAFYGGTFTALPWEVQEAFLTLAARLKDCGRVSRIRCSTRPDAVSAQGLRRLRDLGLDGLELGVQSFCAEPLKAGQRGYDPETALGACRLVQEEGLALGVQLMPGLPGMEEDHFRRDIQICLDLQPDMARLYPCLVLEGTRLADLWRGGGYVPWSLEKVMRNLPPAILALWRRGIRVIRLGLAPEKGLTEQILAGPWHPALGQMLRGQALFLYLADLLPPPEALEKLALCAPRRVQGELFGQHNTLKGEYLRLGLAPEKVRWWEKDYFALIRA